MSEQSRGPVPRFGRGPAALPVVYPAKSRHAGSPGGQASPPTLAVPGSVPVRRAVRSDTDAREVPSRRSVEARVRLRGFAVWVGSCVVSVAGVAAAVWGLLGG